MWADWPTAVRFRVNSVEIAEKCLESFSMLTGFFVILQNDLWFVVSSVITMRKLLIMQYLQNIRI